MGWICNQLPPSHSPHFTALGIFLAPPPLHVGLGPGPAQPIDPAWSILLKLPRVALTACWILLAHQFDGYVTGGELTDRFAGREVKGNGCGRGGLILMELGCSLGGSCPSPGLCPNGGRVKCNGMAGGGVGVCVFGGFIKGNGFSWPNFIAGCERGCGGQNGLRRKGGEEEGGRKKEKEKKRKEKREKEEEK